MNLAFDRIDNSLLGRWWWTVDRWLLASLLLLMGIGAILIVTASPAVATRIGLDGFSLAFRQLVLLPVALAVLLAISLASPRTVRRVSLLGLAGAVLLLVATLLVGPEIKGATRWISVAGFSVQPSEFVKPFLAVVVAWMLAEGREKADMPGGWIALALWAMVVALLLLQPDVGQAFVVTAIFAIQVFLAGLPLVLIVVLLLSGAAGLVGAYLLLPHVTHRINAFLDPEAGDRYQVGRSLEAFMNGGLWGRGPGEGTVKNYLPDAHSDFIFAVAGEELGLVACMIIVALFAFVVLRGLARVLREENLFVLLAAAGLFTQFGLQALINMGSALHLMPTKGMTLPFLSYGGSSLIALAFGMGMALALTRRRVGLGESS